MCFGREKDEAALDTNVAPPASAEATVDLGIDGMTCASCVRRVERALERVPGVASVAINLATKTAWVAFDGRDGAASALVEAVTQAGYAPRTHVLDLVVAGMTCASCVRRVERALLRVPGVTAAEVNLATGRARVITTGPGLAPLAAAIAAAGYEATTPVDPAAEATAPAPRDRALLHVVIAALLSAPLLLGMVAHLAGFGWMLPGWAQFALATPVQFWLGARFYAAGWRAVRAGAGNMDLLVALGTSAAWGLSASRPV